MKTLFKGMKLIFLSFLVFLLMPMVADASDLTSRLKGRILLQVEENGEAWYLNPSTLKRSFLGRPHDAFAIMRDQGVGISNKDLNKIPVAKEYISNLSKLDSDADGYNPYSADKLVIDNNFTSKHLGKIFLQVELHGEAWYINPADGLRYYLGTPADAFKIMKDLGLGISNDNLEKISTSKVDEQFINKTSQSVSTDTELINFAKNISEKCLPMDIIMDGHADSDGYLGLIKFSAQGIKENKCIIQELILKGAHEGKSAVCSLDLPSESELAQMKEADYRLYVNMLPNMVAFDALGEIQNGKRRQCSGDLSDLALVELVNY